MMAQIQPDHLNNRGSGPGMFTDCVCIVPTRATD